MSSMIDGAGGSVSGGRWRSGRGRGGRRRGRPGGQLDGCRSRPRCGQHGAAGFGAADDRRERAPDDGRDPTADDRRRGRRSELAVTDTTLAVAADTTEPTTTTAPRRRHPTTTSRRRRRRRRARDVDPTAYVAVQLRRCRRRDVLRHGRCGVRRRHHAGGGRDEHGHRHDPSNRRIGGDGPDGGRPLVARTVAGDRARVGRSAPEVGRRPPGHDGDLRHRDAGPAARLPATADRPGRSPGDLVDAGRRLGVLELAAAGIRRRCGDHGVRDRVPGDRSGGLGPLRRLRRGDRRCPGHRTRQRHDVHAPRDRQQRQRSR